MGYVHEDVAKTCSCILDSKSEKTVADIAYAERAVIDRPFEHDTTVTLVVAGRMPTVRSSYLVFTDVDFTEVVLEWQWRRREHYACRPKFRAFGDGALATRPSGQRVASSPRI